MGLRGLRSADPTPEEIEKRAAEVRLRWTKKDLRTKGPALRAYQVPIFSPKELALSATRVRLSMD
jgi:hypothetical protein